MGSRGRGGRQLGSLSALDVVSVPGANSASQCDAPCRQLTKAFRRCITLFVSNAILTRSANNSCHRPALKSSKRFRNFSLLNNILGKKIFHPSYSANVFCGNGFCHNCATQLRTGK